MNTEAIHVPGGLLLRQRHPASSRQWAIEGDALTIGRAPSSDIFIDESIISSHHADLIRRGTSWFIADAHSTNGTYVNGNRVGESVIAPGDHIHLGRIEFVVRASDPVPRGSQASTVNREAIPPSGGPPGPAGNPGRPGPRASGGTPPQHVEPPRPGVHVGQVNAESANIADKMWIIQQERRESFLREVAATKTKARWLVWTGFAAFVVGFGLFAYGDLSFIKQISDSIQDGSEADPSISPFGREVGGVPLGLVGWALAAAGMIMLIVGIVLHVVAASRRKRADQEFPVSPPGWAAGRQAP